MIYLLLILTAIVAILTVKVGCDIEVLNIIINDERRMKYDNC